jgi:uncharacterized protein (DUF433 family)
MIAPSGVSWSNVANIGLYPLPMAAKILQESNLKVRSWIEGYPSSDARPIIVRQLPPINGRTVLGFLDLIEARFVKHFYDLDLSMQTIRKVAEKLRRRYNTDHPFATNKRFRTDGKKIFMETVETEGEKRILNLMNDNFEMGDIIEQSLFDDVFYADDLAYRWRPARDLPRIVLDPKYAFGRPVVENAWVPTDTLYAAHETERSIRAVADDFEIEEESVAQAVAYEHLLRSGAGVENQTR